MTKEEDSLSFIHVDRSEEQIKESIISDQQLLYSLLQWVKIDKSKIGLETLLTDCYESFPAFFYIPDQKLQCTLNLSDKDLVTLKLFYEAALRRLKAKIYSVSILQDKTKLLHYLIALLSREYIEHFYIYFTDHNGGIIAEKHQNQGTVNSTSIYVREITRNAFQANAAGLILVHNHPSGIAKPSVSDHKLTYSICCALKMMNIKVFDHIIIGNGSYYSYQENGWLNPENLKKLS